jgi:hypothetical protein
MRRQFFEPYFVIVVEAALVVIDEDAGRRMRCPFVI